MPSKPLIPIPDFEKRIIDSADVEQLKSTTLQADPVTGLSTEPVKKTYADIVKSFNVTEPSEIYTPTEADIERFKRFNPSICFRDNTFSEVHPDEKEMGELPDPSSLFHNLNSVNQSIVRNQ
jgi:hypothetical protein